MVIFKESLLLEQLSAEIKCGSQSVVVTRWVRPAIERAQDVPLFGYIFMVLLCRVSLFVQPFVTILLLVFSLFCFGCVLFLKIDYFVLDLIFDFIVF